MNRLKLTDAEHQSIEQGKSLIWLNSAYQDKTAAPGVPEANGLYQAEARLERFAPVLKQLFPELESSGGLIESPLVRVDHLNAEINPLPGSLFVKADHSLPVAGSIKARGGIHEVLCVAENLALEHGLLKNDQDDYLKLLSAAGRQLFEQYTVAVGSTGNLGLSIGIMGAALGFKAVVHMSSDAKEWKKQRLRNRGVRVVEHEADYGAAVEAGRLQSEVDPFSYFVDDERSPRLFMGYAVAAIRLREQLQLANIAVDAEHPLFVYLPAGVGGAPGGISFGLKQIFGEHVHCFFAEPVQAPCMLIGMAGKPEIEPDSIYDFGLKIDTDADGLAVGTASQWVCDATRDLISGVYIAADSQLYQRLYQLKTLEDIEVEPSAAIACEGPAMLNTDAGRRYLESHDLIQHLNESTHIAWLTGGSFVPSEEYQRYYDKALALMAENGEVN